VGRSKINVHRVRRYLPLLLIGAVFAVALGAGVMLFRYRMQSSSVAAVSTRTPAATSTPSSPSIPRALNYGRAGAEPTHLRGNPNAPVVLEEFGDFECFPCSSLWPILEKLEQDFGNQLAVVFREHPLKIHRYALDAARAAEAAGLQGRFWEMHDMLYRNRANWVPADYVRPYLDDYAMKLRLEVDRFKNDMDGQQVSQRITADQDRGESLSIDRTPILFVTARECPDPSVTRKAYAI
jgi:protein-disulfide isomerase